MSLFWLGFSEELSFPLKFMKTFYMHLAVAHILMAGRGDGMGQHNSCRLPEIIPELK